MRLLFIICCVALVLSSCRKKEDELVDAIATSDCLYAGDLVTFSPQFKDPYVYSNNPVKKVEWSFGDGSANAYTTSIVHAFDKPGTYTVTLTLNGQKVTKTITITAPLSSPFTATMVGERNWTGDGAGQIQELQNDFEYADTTIESLQFAISAIDDRTVQLQLHGIGHLTLTAINETAKTLTFKECGYSRTLTYYYDKDSMTYNSYWTYGKRYGSLSLHTY